MKPNPSARGFVLLFVIVMLGVLTITMTVLSRAMHSRMGATRRHFAREEALRLAERVLEQARQKVQIGKLQPSEVIDGLGVKSTTNGDVTTIETVVAVSERQRVSQTSMVRAVRIRWILARPSAARTGWQADDLVLNAGDALLAR
jgi:Tfp pilus assembly protein PilX